MKPKRAARSLVAPPAPHQESQTQWLSTQGARALARRPAPSPVGCWPPPSALFPPRADWGACGGDIAQAYVLSPVPGDLNTRTPGGTHKHVSSPTPAPSGKLEGHESLPSWGASGARRVLLQDQLVLSHTGGDQARSSGEELRAASSTHSPGPRDMAGRTTGTLPFPHQLLPWKGGLGAHEPQNKSVLMCQVAVRSTEADST